MRKPVYLILSVLVVLVSIIPVFAETSSSSPTFLSGTDTPYLTTVPTDGKVRFSYYDSSFNSYSGWLNSVRNTDQYIFLFNNIFFKVRYENSTYYYDFYYLDSNGNYIAGGNIGFSSTVSPYRHEVWFGSDSSSEPYFYIHGGTKRSMGLNLSVSDLGVSYGDSYVWETSMSVVNRFTFDIPAGYMLQIVSDNDFTITRQFYTISNSWNFKNLVSADGSFSFRSNGAKHGSLATASLVSGADVDSLVPNLVQWQATNENLLGRSTDYSFLNDSNFIEVDSSSSYALVYPYYYGESDPQVNTADLHCVFDVNYVGSVTFNLIGLDNITYVVDNTTFTKNVLDSDLGSTGTQTDTGDGVTVDFGSDNATGGGNANDAPLDDDSTITGVFTRFINGITGLFSTASDAIQSLVQEGNDFFASVLTMFSWLPSEVLAIMFAAFTVLIVIGVVKHIL